MTVLADKIALITGASRGIGRAVAERFVREGAHAILVARTVGGLEAVDDAIQAAGGTATLVPMDLGEPGGIEQLSALIAGRFGRLDILVGNAGMLGDLTPLTHADSKMWDRVIALNLTANWRLIRSMDPLLRAAEHGRAIFVTSSVARELSPYWGPYAVSKAGLEMLVKTYAAETATTQVKANLVDPGIVRTKLRESAMPGEDPLEVPPPESVTDIFVELALPGCTRNGEICAA